MIERVKSEEGMPDALRPEELLTFSPDEIKLVVREGLRRRLSALGHEPKRGQQISGVFLSSLHDTVIDNLLMMGFRVKNLLERGEHVA